MLSHDNYTWDAEAIAQHMRVVRAAEVLVSFLPLSHVAAQVMALFSVQYSNNFTSCIMLCWSDYEYCV
jgi:long-chain-fatty-acid--CoA ligase ACSBG